MPIVFNNVRFRYNKSNDTDVLENVNIKLEANSVYAIVGENGAGKTTLLNLLCRFYVPNSGEITMNGIDIRNIRLEEYRKR
jgi:ABC-type multidrug transport system fused ATPase/permease subunit